MGTTIQYAASTGMANRTMKNSHVFRPPLSFHATKAAGMVKELMRMVLEKESLPAPSAGMGPFLIVGYYKNPVSSYHLVCL